MNSSVPEEETAAMTDEEVVAKVKNGHTDFFEVIIKRYNQQIFRIARSYLTDEEEIKDVMQTAYLKAFEHLEQFRAEASFSTWLIRIVINEALKALKQKKKLSDLSPVTNENGRDLTDITQATPESTIIQKDMNEFLVRSIDQLPPKYRSVLIMREIEQMSTRETAACLNITRANVKVRLFRAKNMLQTELKKVLNYSSLFTFQGTRCDALTRRVMREIKAGADNNNRSRP